MTSTAAFFGTPSAAVPVLAALVEVADVALVVTRQDRPAGRSKRLRPPPVKEAALEWGLPVAQPRRAGEVAGDLESLGVDVAVLAAYGQLIKPELLAVPRFGFVNVHFSVLPSWRGAAPVERAILAGDPATGVSLMVMDEGLDTGPLLATRSTPIRPGETGGGLTARLAALGAAFLAERLPGYLDGHIEPWPQDDDKATSAPKLTSDEARLDPASGAADLDRQVRAYHPRPGAWVTVEGNAFKVLAARAVDAAGVRLGSIELIDRRVLLGTGDGALELVTVQPSGKPVMTATAWMNGRRGERAAVDRT